MIDVSEHFYDDDPARGHPDARTRLGGASYFFLGNGLVQAAVQWAPQAEGTPLGLLLMDPERLTAKRHVASFDMARGLEPTVVRIVAGGAEHAPAPGDLRVEWIEHEGVPAVSARWNGPGLQVEERFYCPDRSTPRIARQVWVRARGAAAALRARTGLPDHGVDVTLRPAVGGGACTWLLYTLDAATHAIGVVVQEEDPLEEPARAYWRDRTTIRFDHPRLDRFFDASRWQLPAVIAASGRVDASIWQYNREWVRDQAWLALALTMAGHGAEAATILERLLRDFVTGDGACLDSSEVRARDEAELDQNGVLLYALHQHVQWTGDPGIAARAWSRVAALADYPLRPRFRHRPSGLLHNAREFWERHDVHGIEPGFELVYQVFVALGLASASALARRLGDDTAAARWQRAADALTAATLADPDYRLADGAFIKRRRLDGRIQHEIVPRPEAQLPCGVPLAGPGPHLLAPDTCTVLPVVFGVVPPDSPLARQAIEDVEPLWNQAWTAGGYGRYHVSGEPDSPGGWPFASLFVARAAVEAGDGARAWRVLDWLDTVPGSAAGAWFEYYGPRASPPFPQVGVIPWTWAELLFLFVHHVLGVRPGARHIRIRPRLLPGLGHARARVPLRGGWLHLEIGRQPGQRTPEARASVDGAETVEAAGELALPYGRDMRVVISLPEEHVDAT